MATGHLQNSVSKFQFLLFISKLLSLMFLLLLWKALIEQFDEKVLTRSYAVSKKVQFFL